MADENNTAPDWRTALPDDLKADPALASFKNVVDLAKSFKETKAFVGDSLRPPGPHATPEARKEFIAKLQAKVPELVYAPEGDASAETALWQRLGKPADPKDYPVEDTVRDAGLDPDELRALAVTAGLTKGQFKTLVGKMAEARLEQGRMNSLAVLALRQEWGAAYEERTLAAKAAGMKLGLTEQEVNALPPKLLKVFANTAKAVGVNPNEFAQHRDGSPQPTMTPDEARRRLAEIRANPAYFNSRVNPALHEQMKAEVPRLTALAFPG